MTGVLHTARISTVEVRVSVVNDVLVFMGSNPVGDSDIFFVPDSCHVDQFTFHISLPSLKFTIFIQLPRPKLVNQ